PVLDALGNSVDFKLDFIANPSGDGFQSLHGQAEVDEDLRQVCAAKIAPTKYLNYIACQNKEVKNVGSNWEKCATEAGIDKAALKACAEGSEGKALLLKSIELANLLRVSASPSIFVDGEQVNVDITQPTAPSAFKSLICSAFDTPPTACEGVVTNVELPASGSTPGCG
ncbi:MAG: thioredoxin domain-containing protein, partial [Candidatus Paceibacterota bacterium]